MKIKTKLSILLALGIFTIILYLLNAPHRIERLKQYFTSHTPSEKTIKLKPNIITSDKVTLAYSEEVYHLSLLSGVFNKSEIELLTDKISLIIPIDKTRAVSLYTKVKSNNQEEYRIIAYGINKANLEKLKPILQEFINKKQVSKKQYYAFKLSGERRVYPHKDFLIPAIGYTKKLIDKKDITYLKGVEGIEASYNASKEDIKLNIDFKLQQAKEKELDEMKKSLSAHEVMSIVIDPISFNIKAFASSNRFNPKDIKRDDFDNLQVNAIRHLFEIDDFLEPIDNAISSQELKDGYKKFGFYEKSGIDLKYEKIFNNQQLKLINNPKNYKVNFLQLVKMYAVFYGNGNISKPRIVKKNNQVLQTQVISKEIANKIKEKLPVFFQKMKAHKVFVEFDNYNREASINMEELTIDGKRYLQAYFIVDKENLPLKIK